MNNMSNFCQLIHLNPKHWSFNVHKKYYQNVLKLSKIKVFIVTAELGGY